MMENKSSFLTFVFSLIPGAGEMYLGMMKKGVAIMCAFAGVFMLAAILGMGILSCILPIIWFYSFFDTFNVKRLTMAERKIADDEFADELYIFIQKDWKTLLGSRKHLIGIVVLIIGVYVIFANIVRPILWQLQEYVYWLAPLAYNFSSIVVGIVIIYVGIRILRDDDDSIPKAGKKKKVDFVEYKATEEENHSNSEQTTQNES